MLLQDATYAQKSDNFSFVPIGYSDSRNLIPCDGLEKIAIKAFIAVNGYRQTESIKKSDLLKYDILIGLSDTSYKIIGFSAAYGYDCDVGSLIEVIQITYRGNRINSDDAYLRKLRVGQTLTLECIKVEKNGKQYLIDWLFYEITN